VAQGKGPPNTPQKIQICADLGFLGPNSEYVCVNFLAHILTSLILSLDRRAVGAAGGVALVKCVIAGNSPWWSCPK
jgi:hypothetical protein